MDTLLYSCCGLDVHRDMIEACIIKGIGSSPEIIRQQFQTTRKELQELGTWLSANDCYTVAMESTGVYWKPVFQMLESIPGCVADIWVVNAHNMRNVPGRKSDVADAEWIASLLRHGLLEKALSRRQIFKILGNTAVCIGLLFRNAAAMSIAWKSFCKLTALNFPP